MKKLMLRIDDLKVESFVVEDGRGARGTVHGRSDAGETGPDAGEAEPINLSVPIEMCATPLCPSRWPCPTRWLCETDVCITDDDDTCPQYYTCKRSCGMIICT